MKLLFKSIFVLVLVIGLFSCEGNERNCPEFNFDISFWKESENVVESQYFINGLDTIEFVFDSLVLSPEHVEFEVSGSSGSVTCKAFKKYSFSSIQLNIEFSEIYENYEDAFQNRTWVNYNLRQLNNDTMFQLASIALFYDTISIDPRLESLSEFAQNGISYLDVDRMQILSNQNLILNSPVEPIIFSSLYFLQGKGLIGFETDNKKYIRIE